MIKVGFLTPLSGNNATYGAQCKAAGQMIADVINEEHPEMAMALAKTAGIPALNGAKIELVFADSKGDPTTATSEAKRLITEEGIVALTGQYTSAITKAVAVVTETYGIPLLTAGSSPSLTTPETVSYTHLDVYKRQVGICVVFLLLVQFKPKGLFGGK